MMLPFLVIQAGNPPAAIRERFGSFAQMFQPLLAPAVPAIRVVRSYADEALPAPATVSGVLITGSPGNVTDAAPWMLALQAWLGEAHALGLPLLGVCFGHQILAQALGGQVGYHPAGREVGTRRITLHPAAQQDPWLAGLPAQFAAQLIHEQTVLQPPAGAQVLGYNAHDACQILRYGPRAVSVQFHPEFSAEIMRAYVHAMAAKLAQEGLAPAQLAQAVQPSPLAAGLVARFLQVHAPSACSTTN